MRPLGTVGSGLPFTSTVSRGASRIAWSCVTGARKGVLPEPAYVAAGNTPLRAPGTQYLAGHRGSLGAVSPGPVRVYCQRRRRPVLGWRPSFADRHHRVVPSLGLQGCLPAWALDLRPAAPRAQT